MDGETFQVVKKHQEREFKEPGFIWKILWKSWQKAKNGCNQNIKVKSIDDEIVATVNGVCISETVALEVNNRSLWQAWSQFRLLAYLASDASNFRHTTSRSHANVAEAGLVFCWQTWVFKLKTPLWSLWWEISSNVDYFDFTAHDSLLRHHSPIPDV